MSSSRHMPRGPALALATFVALASASWTLAQTPTTAPTPIETPSPAASIEAPAPASASPAASQPAPVPIPVKAAPKKVVEEATVKVSKPGTFEIHLRDAGIREAFELIGSEGHKNIVATKEVNGKVNADLYDVTFKEALDAIVKSNGYAYEEDGSFIFVMTSEQFKKQQEANRKMSVATYRLAYVTATDVKSLITPVMSKDGSIAVTPSAAMGITSSKTDAGGNTYATEDVLVVRDYEDVLEKVAGIIKEVDIKPEQVLIEATILRATLNESTALGIDFQTLAGVDFQSFGGTTAGDTQLTLNPKTPVTPQNTPSGTIRTDFNGAVPAGGASLGFVGNEVAVFLRALESVTDTTVLANPKLLVLNKQRGEVMVGNRDGYLTTTVTETVATQTVQFLETGTRLIVRPYIGKNGYVRMELHPEDSSGSVATVGESVLPSETTTEVTSNVLVRDGHTIVIGGLFRERTVNGRSQVPVLGNIPGIGAAFRNTSDSTLREEVIILITPRIIKPAQDEASSEQIKDDVERFRIGQRKGLQWFDRSRLAQSSMRCAKKSLAEGDTCKALWNVDMALSMNPTMEEGIRMKERLTNQAYWADESRESSVRVVIPHMIMQELGKPVDRVVPPCKPRNADKIAPEVREKLGIEKRFEDPMKIEFLCEPCMTDNSDNPLKFKTTPDSVDAKKADRPKVGPPVAAGPASKVEPVKVKTAVVPAKPAGK